MPPPKCLAQVHRQKSLSLIDSSLLVDLTTALHNDLTAHNRQDTSSLLDLTGMGWENGSFQMAAVLRTVSWRANDIEKPLLP
jgi:hypothetical protein